MSFKFDSEFAEDGVHWVNSATSVSICSYFRIYQIKIDAFSVRLSSFYIQIVFLLLDIINTIDSSTERGAIRPVLGVSG
jgi:hypothetical protein